MFLRSLTNKSTEICSAKLNRLKAVLNDADAVIIGAGSRAVHRSGSFQKAGFDKHRIFYTRGGDYGLFFGNPPNLKYSSERDKV